jgi:hypothetical protein
MSQSFHVNKWELSLSATDPVSSLWVQLFILAMYKGNDKHDVGHIITANQF